MATYKEIFGTNIEVLASDPANPVTGQVWYNSTDNVVKGAAATTSGAWQIEKEALHIWPRGGFMLIALPNLDGSFTVTLFLKKKGEPSFESLNDRESVINFFQEHFSSAMPLLPDLETDYFDNPAGILGTIRCEPWHHSN